MIETEKEANDWSRKRSNGLKQKMMQRIETEKDAKLWISKSPKRLEKIKEPKSAQNSKIKC